MTKNWSNVIFSGSMLLVMAGCAGPQNLSPEFRLSSKAAVPILEGSLVQRGKAQLSAGLHAMAIETFRAEIRQSPESAEAYNGLAIAYDRIGRPDLARRYFEVALAKAPDEPRYSSNLARFFVRSGEPELAANLGIENAVATVAVVAPVISPEPPVVALTTVTGFEPSAKISTLVEAMPVLNPVTAVGRVPEFLGKKGVLSGSVSVSHAQTIMPKLSVIVSAPAMPLPSREPIDRNAGIGDLPRDPRRSGARMERMSLGEVMLITTETPPALPRQKPNAIHTSFASFDQRLSGWLAQAIAMEHQQSSPAAIENSAMFAALERAEIDVALAQVDTNGPVNLDNDLVEFAYIFFDDAASS
jgi:hypothetical protein